MKIIRLKFLFLLAALTFCLVGFAQSVEYWLGQPYNSFQLSEVRNAYKTENPKETFLPHLKSYRVDYTEDGISMNYNSSFSLYEISLYDSGYTYKSYKDTLPFGIDWGMKLLQIEQKTGMLDLVERNEYKRQLVTEDYTMLFYFTDKRLNLIKITASEKSINDNLQEVAVSSGIRLYPDGKTVEGNVLSGTGTMSWANGSVLYKGEWSYGLPHGFGQYLDSFGNKYEGNFKLGYFWGEGKLLSKPYGYSYVGHFAMGKKQGLGKIVYKNNTSGYEGEWVQDYMHGIGTYVLGSSFNYVGQMTKNAITGKGTLQTPDGIIEGTFANGKPHGICKHSTPDGQQYIMGNFVDGKKDGVFTVSNNGEKQEILYENDIEVKSGVIPPEEIKKARAAERN